MKNKKELPFNELIIYWLYCIASLGAVWALKIVIKKAVMEAENA